MGLSPRVRGNLVDSGERVLPEGSIPARAGEPLINCEACFRDRVYPRAGIVTLLNGRAANWHRTQAQAAAVTVCHRPIAWLRNWRNVFRDIRWRWTLKVL